MKIKITSGFLILLFITCSKENSDIKQTHAGIKNKTVATTAETSIPLVDLGAGKYMGYTGGLYPGGLNTPSGQYATDLFQISNSIYPLDTLGNVSGNGKIAFISLGASIGGKNMKALITKTTNNPATNPKLLLFNCNEGGQYSSLTSIMNPYDPYWLHVSDVIGRNSSYKQIQIVYLETV